MKMYNIQWVVLSKYYNKRKDLSLTISADMKVSKQCEIAASMVNQIVGIIRRHYSVQGKRTNNTARIPARKSSKESNQNYTKTQ